MRSPVLAAAAAAVLLLGSPAAAVPGPRPTRAALQRRADPTDVWVSVNNEGKPSTVTPSVSTVSGTPSVVDGAAPHDLTATVFTFTSQGDVRTSTGTAPIPSATGKNGVGVFAACHNAEGENAPFCEPRNNSTLHPGTTYYVTWDPSFFNVTNTSVVISGYYVNRTTGEMGDRAFASDKTPLSWGFYAWRVPGKMMAGGKSTNISLAIAKVEFDASTADPVHGPLITVAHPRPYQQEHAKAPGGPALYIGLPVVLGFVALVLVGTCLWNRKTRRIDLGNALSRGRRGYGIAKSRARRVGGGRKGDIRLTERDVGGFPPEPQYRDDDEGRRRGAGWDEQVPGRDADDAAPPYGVPRRDSDALGSLAGTPTEDREMGFDRAGRPNAFRDELSRQDRERS